MKPQAEVLKADERYRIMMIDDPITGLRPIRFDDHYAMVSGLRLDPETPEVTGRLFTRALHAFLYGWFDYDLMVVASGQALATLEFALKSRLGAPAAKMKGLKPRLTYAVEQGLLRAPEPSDWGDDHAMLAYIRNEIAHGSDHVYPPNIAATIFDRCRTLIHELYGLSGALEASAFGDPS